MPTSISVNAYNINADAVASPPSPIAQRMLFNSTLASFFGGWPHDFLQLLVAPPEHHPMSAVFADGYRGPTLHFGEREYVVVGFWKMGTGLGLAASMLVIALVAIMHEAVLGLRFFLEREQTLLSTPDPRQIAERNRQSQQRQESGSSSSRMYVNEPKQAEAADGARTQLREILRRTFSRARMAQALLYLIQWTLFVFAFVLVPCSTFNVPLILAALLGKTAGYLLFIGSPAMESVERIPASPTSGGRDGPIQLAATRKNLRSF